MIVDLKNVQISHRTNWKRTAYFQKPVRPITFLDIAVALPLLFFAGIAVGVGIMLAIS